MRIKYCILLRSFDVLIIMLLAVTFIQLICKLSNTRAPVTVSLEYKTPIVTPRSITHSYFSTKKISTLTCFGVMRHRGKIQVLIGPDLQRARFFVLGDIIAKQNWTINAVAANNVKLLRDQLSWEMHCED